ncbi:JmjC domain-containing protein [Basilea psittacipulmonis]|uniref:Cupin n=1 Tax=Basilea psittacipulmonis DSM 24701 TaxID=1072685 RepID=A0A077DFE2_9BURK|nr:cupin domain-containing protein [Basilea psittacipulmonis]AIL32866.1 cupin [Basilea psittacipulmonis DSM 24701]
MNINEPITLLGNISPAEFMRDYWQKKPLLIRQAFPNFKPPISIKDLHQLGKKDEVESRLVWREKGQWNMEQGPFESYPPAKEPDWTLLVQSVDIHHEKISDLIQHFRFIPDARFDDVMISCATQGGGVGPHFDTYDVFLLQGQGKRRWRISTQTDKELIPGLPCRILKNFQVEQEWVLEPGDMLYLPPHCAHDGIAETNDCMTISFGFRTITSANLARGMLEAAADQISSYAGMGYGTYSEPPLPKRIANFRGDYHDKRQKATQTPAQLPELMINKAVELAQKITFDHHLAARFIGIQMSEPNQLALFMPSINLNFDLEAILETGFVLKLNKASKMLYYGDEIYFNGECFISKSPAIRKLADERSIPIIEFKDADKHTLSLLTDWLDAGWMDMA